jgi:hypothetical protein
MNNNSEITQKEKEITSQAVRKLRAVVRSEISKTSKSRTGLAERTGGAGSKFKFGRLQRITMVAPYYIFMQHYGFEGKKSNGVNQRLQTTDVFQKALDSSKILETLADEISELRIDQVTTLINFKSAKNG